MVVPYGEGAPYVEGAHVPLGAHVVVLYVVGGRADLEVVLCDVGGLGGHAEGGHADLKVVLCDVGGLGHDEGGHVVAPWVQDDVVGHPSRGMEDQ